MRIDVTVRQADGTERDVALVAPAGTATGVVLAALRRALPEARVGWIGGRRLDGTARFDPSYLPRGAVLSHEPVPVVEGFGLCLDVIGGPSAGASAALARGATTIGRADECDVVLADPRASRRHATVTPTRDGAVLHDLASTAGTFVDGVRIHDAVRLAPGDTMRIGDSRLVVRPPATDRTARPVAGQSSIIEWPPDPPPESHRGQLAAAMTPAIAGVVLAAVLRSIEFLAFALLSPLTFVITSGIERSRRRRTHRTLRHGLESERARLNREIATALKAERNHRLYTHPDPVNMLRTTSAVHSPANQPDMFLVRLGLGAVPSRVSVRIGDTVSAAGELHDVPITIDLQDGPWTIVGPRGAREAAARWLVAQLAAQSSPRELELALLTSSPATWHWMRWLPHLQGRIACTRRDADELLALVVQRGSPSASVPQLFVLADGRVSSRLVTALAEVSGTAGLLLTDDGSDVVRPERTIRINGDTATRARIGADAEFVVDQVDEKWADRLARLLAPTGDGDSEGPSLPTQCRLVDIAGLESASAQAIAARWCRSDDGLHAPIGRSPEGVVELDLVRDGPHALIAGTTGSGKSELLQSVLAALAASYPPSELTFLLVDYKGGAALAPFAALPHTVGLVTDLDDHLGRRVLTALRSELRHRERLLAGAGAADIAAYCNAGQVMPRLVLLVDELAALTESFRGLVPGLVEIAQRGRSLGLHLVLATQRPSGVVSADIRANIGLCIALRTAGSAESVDVIDDAAAAAIPATTPGRAYLRAGPRLQALQCARVSTPATDDAVRVELLGDWLRPTDLGETTGETDLHRIVAAVRAAAQGHPPARRPWLPALPARVTAGELPDADDRSRLAIGLADLPGEQRRAAATVDPGAGSLVCTGGPRSGRTSALVGLALAAAERHPPDDLEIHAVGTVASRTAIRTLPHVGTLAPLDDEGRLATRLVERLAAGVSRTGEARDRPTGLLLIDDWESVSEASEHVDGGRTVERILALARDGPARGVTVAIAGGRTTLAARVTAGAHTRFVLRLSERTEYAGAGIDPADVPVVMPPGRAVRAGDGVEVQFCDPSEHEVRAAACREHWPAPQRRLVLRSLPHTIRLSDLSGSAGWVLGVGGDAAAPVRIDLRSGRRRLLVAGLPGSGRTTVLQVLLAQSESAQLWVAAPRGSPLADAAEARAVRVVHPDDRTGLVPPPSGVLLVDDAESFLDAPAGDTLLEWLRTTADGVAVVAARSDALAVSSRGLGAELRRAGCGVLLQPGPLDGELLGARVPRPLHSELPGRGVLVPDPAWQLG
ncbi:MAG TPA: FtsK/SpoIIIE domain-containing protein, partial [Jatrophihabitantaceae bacterium]